MGRRIKNAELRPSVDIFPPVTESPVVLGRAAEGRAVCVNYPGGIVVVTNGPGPPPS